MKSLETTEFLLEELKEYEKITQMNEEERTALYEWVTQGHSVYENGCMAVYEGDTPCTFLEVYRDIAETKKVLDDLSPRARKNYIARLNHVDTLDNLAQDLHKAWFRISIYEQVLHSHGLLEGANAQIEQLIQDSKELEAKWNAMYPDMESPFNTEEVNYGEL